MNINDAADILSIQRQHGDQDMREAADKAALDWAGPDADAATLGDLRLAFYDGVQYGLRCARGFRDER